MIDLRSDTVTRPTPAMLEAMTKVPTGDDVFGEDPTVNAFQEKIAGMFGFEAGLFVPSGVMGNQVSLKVLTRPGDEVIIDENGHVFNYENTSAALISSVQLRPLPGRRGKLRPGLVRGAVRSGMDWEPRPRVVVLENTTNKGGGVCYRRAELQELRKVCDQQGLLLHLDGARIWNALEATGIEPAFFGTIADTMCVSFSKGLGAPVGSMILSSAKRIGRARRYRKMLGGGMRQIGILAAAADYGVTHHRALLADDHRRAKALAAVIADCSGLQIDPDTVETNILIFDVRDGNARDAVEKLKEEGVSVVPFGPQTLRATFHFDVDDEDLEVAESAFRKLFG